MRGFSLISFPGTPFSSGATVSFFLEFILALGPPSPSKGRDEDLYLSFEENHGKVARVGFDSLSRSSFRSEKNPFRNRSRSCHCSSESALQGPVMIRAKAFWPGQNRSALSRSLPFPLARPHQGLPFPVIPFSPVQGEESLPSQSEYLLPLPSPFGSTFGTAVFLREGASSFTT